MAEQKQPKGDETCIWDYKGSNHSINHIISIYFMSTSPRATMSHIGLQTLFLINPKASVLGISHFTATIATSKLHRIYNKRLRREDANKFTKVSFIYGSPKTSVLMHLCQYGAQNHLIELPTARAFCNATILNARDSLHMIIISLYFLLLYRNSNISTTIIIILSPHYQP